MSIVEVLSTEIPNVQCTSESVLLVGVQNAVHDNHESLQALARVLQKIPDTAELGSNILNEYQRICTVPASQSNETSSSKYSEINYFYNINF